MEPEKAELRIYGMACDDCVATVTRGLREQEGVPDVRISLREGSGEVELDSARVKSEDLLKNRVFSKPSHYRATLADQ
ncbi:MAG: heavy-metal-associated domain-containing protein [Candidatus Thermoplasmatota archaeon]|nr:heavy-metal-associated domain-containing protein [Candidatus Thermoplasmatota archaeon]